MSKRRNKENIYDTNNLLKQSIKGENIYDTNNLSKQYIRGQDENMYDMNNTLKPPTKKEIVRSVHILEQIKILEKNLLYITIMIIKMLKTTVFKDAKIKLYRPITSICRFYKFISLNLCYETGLARPLGKFFNLISNLFLPKSFKNFKLDDIKALYEENLRQKENLKNQDFIDLDKQSYERLRFNLIAFTDKIIKYFPDIESNKPIYPLCELSLFFTERICKYSYVLIPFMIFFYVTTQIIIPEEIIEQIVTAFKDDFTTGGFKKNKKSSKKRKSYKRPK
jgi:hypothetical protein